MRGKNQPPVALLLTALVQTGLDEILFGLIQIGRPLIEPRFGYSQGGPLEQRGAAGLPARQVGAQPFPPG